VGVESLIELPYLMTHDKAQGTEASAPIDLIRYLSVLKTLRT